MEFNVIDIDPAMHYDAGQEVIGTVDAASPEEAIAKVLHAIGVDVLKAHDADGYAAHILKYTKAIPVNPPKILKVRMILAALYNVDIDRFPPTHGEVQARMRHTLKRNLDWEYEQALKVPAKAIPALQS